MTLQHQDLTVEGIKQIYLDCENDEAKYEALVKFYGMLTIGSSIIFVKVSPIHIRHCKIYPNSVAEKGDCRQDPRAYGCGRP